MSNAPKPTRDNPKVTELTVRAVVPLRCWFDAEAQCWVVEHEESGTTTRAADLCAAQDDCRREASKRVTFRKESA